MRKFLRARLIGTAVLVSVLLTACFNGPSPVPLDLQYIQFFSATDGIGGPALWKTSGAADFTELVKDFSPGVTGPYGFTHFDGRFTTLNSTVYFIADDGVHGQELWKTDGSAAGTVLVKDVNPGVNGSRPGSLAVFNGALYFSADDGSNGRELWKTDGTAAGTMLVKDIHPSGSSNPDGFIVFKSALYFAADDGVIGSELWKTDGTASGTVLVKDVYVNGAIGSNPRFFAVLNDTLFFNADGELWKTDGTATGTVLVKDIYPGGSSNPFELIVFNGAIYFSADDGINGNELWKSDGTEAGTVLVKDINPGPSSSGSSGFTVFNRGKSAFNANSGGDMLYFSANDGTNGKELWKTDGTEVGTVLVKDINPGVGDSRPSHLTALYGGLTFAAMDGATGFELWKSDGSTAGTLLVKDINPGAGDGMNGD